MKRKSHTLPLALGLAAILVAGLLLILQMSFAPGNVYPPYSTLRTDPLGASVLMESLQAIPGQKASRNYQALPKLIQHAGDTFIELGGDFDDSIMQSPENYAYLEELLATGSRLVLLSAPVVDNIPSENKKKEEADSASEPVKEKSAPDKHENSPSKKGEKEPSPKLVSLCDKWGFALEILPRPEKKDSEEEEKPVLEEALPTAESGFEKPLHWSSHLVFRNLNPAWKVLYEKNGKPVLIERPFGKGSIVLGSDAYFVSNEALKSDRRTDLIIKVLGTGKNIQFSETQHGLYESTGMADLLRRYHLQGTLACLVLLAGLFVWRSTLSLIPAGNPLDATAPASLGPTARDGIIHLLQRNLNPLQALQEGMDRWVKFCGKTVSPGTRLKAHDYLFELRSKKKFTARDIPDAYKTLQTMMTERK